jgi:hypothetical protein
MKRTIPPTAGSLTDELLKLDPSLAPKRAEVEQVVSKLLESRPDTRWRPDFERELLAALRPALSAAAGERMMGEEAVAPHFSFFSFFPMDTRFFFAGGGALLGALLVFVTLQQPFSGSGTGSPAANETVLESGVTSVAAGAFGKLAPEAGGLGGGGLGSNEAISARPQSGGGGGGGVATDAMMVAPDQYRVSRFTYAGTLNLPTEDQMVYRRVKPGNQPSGQNMITGFAAGLINWSALGGLRLQSVSLVGGEYNVYVDYTEGTVSVNRVFDPSDRPDFQCRDQECYDRYRLSESDMIPDEEAFQIARAFAEELDIDLSIYGEPEITENWQIMYARTADKASYWFPEQVSVVFPLILDGQTVYEEYGQPHGLTIAVDIRLRKAASLYNHYLQRYEQSAYAPVADEQRVRDAISHGSMYFWDDPSAQYVDVTLGEPTTALMHYYQWNQAGGQSQELFVPALVFPVTGEMANEYENRRNVVVPLIQELYDQVQDQVVPFPMPLIQEDAPASDDVPVDADVMEEVPVEAL